MKMKKLALAVWAGCLIFAAASAQAAPYDDLKAALEKKHDPAGAYTLNLNIPFKTLGTMVSNTVLDLQTQPYCAKAVTTTTIKGENPETSTIYDTMEGNQVKTYSQVTLHKGDKTKSWVYKLTPVEGGGSVVDSVRPDSLLTSVTAVQEFSRVGGVQHLRVTFDNAKLYSGFGVQHAIKAGNSGDDAQTDADFNKEFEKLRKSGNSYGDVYITDGQVTKFSADITKPVKAFEDAIFKGVSRKTHSGAIGDWILGMLLKTGASTLTIDSAPLTGAVTIPEDVVKAAVPDPTSNKK